MLQSEIKSKRNAIHSEKRSQWIAKKKKAIRNTKIIATAMLIAICWLI